MQRLVKYFFVGVLFFSTLSFAATQVAVEKPSDDGSVLLRLTFGPSIFGGVPGASVNGGGAIDISGELFRGFSLGGVFGLSSVGGSKSEANVGITNSNGTMLMGAIRPAFVARGRSASFSVGGLLGVLSLSSRTHFIPGTGPYNPQGVDKDISVTALAAGAQIVLDIPLSSVVVVTFNPSYLSTVGQTEGNVSELAVRAGIGFSL